MNYGESVHHVIQFIFSLSKIVFQQMARQAPLTLEHLIARLQE